MFKVTQAPMAPLIPAQSFTIQGTADVELAGKHLLVVIDHQLKILGPAVSTKGTWHVDLAFQEPGKHWVGLALDKATTEVTVEVSGPVPSASSKPFPSPPIVEQSSVAPGMPTLKELVLEAHGKKFSDVHLAIGKVPRFRDRGFMELTSYPETDAVTFDHWLREILTEKEIQKFKSQLDFDGAAQYDFTRVRVNLFDTVKGYAMVLRLVPMDIPSMQTLGLPPVFPEVICHFPKGLVLITGPTGSGKSTTLAALIGYINQEMPKHIITIEDPIEFVHRDDQCVISQREVGLHTLEFDRALKAALREDPDIILIGEMRDRDTVNTALKAAQTGHLVFGTLHTNSAVKTIERLLNLYQPDEQEVMRIQIAESLVAVAAQGLVRTTENTRAPIFEIMINTDTIRDYMRQGEIDEVEEQMKDGSYYGMTTMNQSIFELYEAGRITEETALEASPKPHEMKILLKGGTI